MALAAQSLLLVQERMAREKGNDDGGFANLTTPDGSWWVHKLVEQVCECGLE